MENALRDFVYVTWGGKDEVASKKVRNSRRTVFCGISALG